MPRWKYSALAAAAVAFVGLHAPDALALALGPITVQSALGEPLRAEIDIPQITPAEADSLRATTASPEAFRAQGLEYSSTAGKVRMQLHRHPDGRAVLRLRSDVPVQEPFVDFVVDARWSNGHISRSYTMLFDPPTSRRAPATVAAPAQTTPSAAPPSRNPSRPARAAAPAPSQEVERTSAPAPRSADASASVAVRPGDTAGRIANSHRAAGVSLDQMLVAMLRANPEAFIGGNVNRIKAGAVLQMPSPDKAQATSAREARQLVAVQSRDFNAFRRKLAQAAPAAQQATAERSASGSVQTRVDDTSASAAAPDKLTLSKGAMQGKKTTEELLAQRKQGNAASARAEELAKNISELSQLSAASSAPAGGAPVPSATPPAASTGIAVPNPGVPVPAPAPAPAPEPAATAATPAAGAPATDTPATPATPAAGATPPGADTETPPAAPAEGATAAETPAPVESEAPPAPPQPKAPPPTPEPVPEPSFLSELMQDPMVPLAGGALLLLLAGYGGYRVMQRRRDKDPMDSAFLDSRMQPDSFFGASGGQRVDTAGSETTTGGSSLAFSHSQLDAGGDVDPVAEADVYLAYGRDLQAEEILKEAARHNPTRVSVHAKLGEIYAKRQDRKALEAAASEVYKLTQGEGPDWARMADLGSTLDPENPLYRPGGRPSSPAAATPADNGFASTFAAATVAAAAAPSAASGDIDLDLDLDLDLDMPGDALTEAPPAPSFADAVAVAAATAPAEPVPAVPSPAPEPTWSADLAAPLDMDMDLDMDAPAEKPTLAADIALEDGAQEDTARQPLSLDESAAAPEVLEMPEFPEAPALPEIPDTPHDSTADTDNALASLDHLDFSVDALPPLDLPEVGVPDISGPEEDAFQAPDSGMLEFDLDDLSLDLDLPESAADAEASNATPAAAPAMEDPLATKLALAQEFNMIGDSEGARTLIEEVIAESSGDLKARAQRLLTEID